MKPMIDKNKAYFKVLVTILSSNTTQQLRVAENLLLAYDNLLKISGNKDSGLTSTLIWVLNTRKAFIIS